MRVFKILFVFGILYIHAPVSAVTSTYGSSIDAITNYSAAAQNDRVIMQNIRDKIDNSFNAQDYRDVNINISYGVITLYGYIDSEWQITDLKNKIRSVQGVKEINDAQLRVRNPTYNQF